MSLSFISRACLATLIFLVSGSLYASPGRAASTDWTSVDPETGLITVLPRASAGGLVRQLEALRADLGRRLGGLEQDAEEKRFDTKDGVITLVMPGGLLYAAYRKHEQQQAEQRLAAVSRELDEIGVDIAALSVGAGGSMVALAGPLPLTP